jgi:hypothetical protein
MNKSNKTTYLLRLNYKTLLLLTTCFILNIIKHNNIIIGILYVGIFALSLYFYQIYAGKKIITNNLIYLIFLGLAPLFNHYPKDPIVLLFTIITLVLFLVYLKVKSNKFVLCLVILWALFSGLYTSDIIKLPFLINKDLLIYSDNWSRQAINMLNIEALYLPYKIRPLIFNNGVYLYTLISNVFEIFTIKNLYEIVLLVNLYPLLSGVVLNIKKGVKERYIFYLYILIILLTTGISRAPDNFSSLLLLSPFFVYLILVGLENINKKIYFILALLSFVILFSPIT